MSNSFKLCPAHFSRGGEKFCRGTLPPCVSLGYGPGLRCFAMYFLKCSSGNILSYLHYIRIKSLVSLWFLFLLARNVSFRGTQELVLSGCIFLILTLHKIKSENATLWFGETSPQTFSINKFKWPKPNPFKSFPCFSPNKWCIFAEML